MDNNKTCLSLPFPSIPPGDDQLEEKAVKTAMMTHSFGCYEQRDETPAFVTTISDITNPTEHN